MFTFFMVFSLSAHGMDLSSKALWPVDPDEAALEAARASLDLDLRGGDELVSRVGAVALSVGFFLSRAEGGDALRVAAAERSFHGETLYFDFFPDSSYAIELDQEARPEPDVLSLGGRIKGRDLSTFSMSITADSYVISLQDMDTAMLYRAVGDTATGLGQVIEFELEKLPERIYLPPMVE